MKVYKSIDHVLVDQPTDPAIKDAAQAALAKDKNPKLKVTIDASHSGVLTNRRVYPYKFVSTGYKTFFSKASGGTSEFDKPVLKHHELYADPIGRVIKATYTPLKTGRALEEDFKSPDQVGGKGSGVITVEAIITDAESIQKIIDGRYLSVSAGHSTDSMTCSICNKSILKCDHWPGKYYDEEGEEVDQEEGFLCFYITGNMDYNELSFVNMPAQPPAKLINFNWEDHNKSSFEKDNLIVESMIRGKKSLVRDFSLVDDDGEFNLLKGSHQEKNKKVSVAMNTETEKSCEEPGVNINPLSGEKSKNVIAKDSNIANSKKDNDMDQNKEKGLDVATLEASLTAVNEKNKTLEGAAKDAAQKIASLEATVATKNSEIERLTKAQTDSQIEVSKALATALASFRMKLNKPDTKDLDTSAKFDEYINKLAKRSADSLRDSISDTIQELSQAPVDQANSKDTSGASNLVTTKAKVTPTAQVGSTDKTVRAGNEKAKTQDTKSPLDKALS